MKRTTLQWSLLLTLAVISMTVAWALAADSPLPLFNSPIPTLGWEQGQTTPTPRPQPVVLAITPGIPILSSGNRGYWHFDEANTSDRIDSSSNGNMLTNINGVSWTTNGKIGNASDFERDNSQYLKIESYEAVGLNFGLSFTLAGWIKRESTGSDMVLVSKYDYGTNDRAYRLMINSDNNLRLIVSPDGTYNSAYSAIGGATLTSANDWYHIAAVFDAGAQTFKIYLNGILDAELNVTYNTVFQSSAPFVVGADMNNGQAADFYDGLMDDWRVYSRALSATEIQTLSGILTPMGEVGQIAALNHTPQTITLNQTYTNPVIFAQPASFNGSAASVVRITDVQPGSFTLYIHEAPNKDGPHVTETISYLVFETGQWELPDGTKLDVGLVNTTATVGKQISNQWQSVSFNTPFPTTPIIISQAQSDNDPHWVKTRQQNVTTSGFDMAMEEEESKTTSHGTETIGWLAVESGQGTWAGHNYEFAQTTDAVTQSWYQITFGQNFGQAPRLIATMGTYDGGDSAHLRYTNLATTGVQIMVEEDTTLDTETSHTTEVVHFLVIEGDGTLTANPQ